MGLEISPQHRDRPAEREFALLARGNRREDFWPLDAVANFQITNEPISFSEAERFRHLAIFGKTGSGKSTTVKSLALRDIRMGKAVVFIDPHGDDARDLIDAIPSRYQEKFCYYDLSSLTDPVPFNIFDSIPNERVATRAANAVEGFRDIWHKAWSERMSSFLLHGLAVLAEHGLTLADLSALYMLPTAKKDTPTHHRQMQAERERQKLFQSLKNPSTRNFWLAEHPSYPETYKREAPGAILARIGQLTASPHCYRAPRSMQCTESK